MRAQIANGALPLGTRAPSTRALAAELGVSRTTLTAVYEQLAAEGFLVTAAGRAARVASTLSPGVSIPVGEAVAAALAVRAIDRPLFASSEATLAHAAAHGKTSVLFVDTFNGTFESDNAFAAARVLRGEASIRVDGDGRGFAAAGDPQPAGCDRGGRRNELPASDRRWGRAGGGACGALLDRLPTL